MRTGAPLAQKRRTDPCNITDPQAAAPPRFCHADNARKSIISHSMLLGREPINSKWSTDVRFGAHSGLKSDITALPKCATSGLVHSSKSQLLFDHLVPAGEQRRREIEAGGRRLA